MAGFIVYKAYNFKTKDPALDELKTVLEDEYGEKINGRMLKRIEDKGGPSVSCMRGWFFGETLRPMSASMEAAARAAGYRRVFVPINGKGGRSK